jgi:DNA-directed RNA polymerase subunit omega
MDAKKDNFTNEKLSKKFVSQFDLVNYAIRLAENMIRTGRDPRVKTEFQNRSMQILAEIAQDKDQFDEIPEDIVEFEENAQRQSHQAEERVINFAANPKFTEKKKARKIFND